MTTADHLALVSTVRTDTATLRVYQHASGRLVHEQDRHGSTWFAVQGGRRSHLYDSADTARRWLEGRGS